MRVLAARLGPGDDLERGVLDLAATASWRAGWVASCVGSLSRVELRLAGQAGTTAADGLFEILALVGTLSVDGAHLHLAVADHTGRTLGGHLRPGCVVRTTAELVLTVTDELRFGRAHDPATGFRELTVER
jgi:predicted DNA-binding protein with PD1-like motif